MSIEQTHTVVVGAGQAGIAMSEHLSRQGVPHIVLERHRIAERWDSLVANGPAWHDRFPGREFAGDPDGFPGKETVADYFVAYAEQIAAPVRCGVEVREVRRIEGGRGFRVETSEGVIEAASVVAATGPFQRPVMPAIVPQDADVMQMHSSGYRNPGARGGHTVDFRNLAEQGITLVGRTEAFADGVMRFAPDLAGNIARGDANYLSVLDEADAHVARHGLDLPEEPAARRIGPDPACVREPVLELDLAAAGIGTILWATGFAVDYGWLKADTFDEKGKPLHRRGVSREPGVYFLGLPWLSRRGSSFIWGVWHDAMHIADQIAIQRSYLDHHDAANARVEAA